GCRSFVHIDAAADQRPALPVPERAFVGAAGEFIEEFRGGGCRGAVWIFDDAGAGGEGGDEDGAGDGANPGAGEDGGGGEESGGEEQGREGGGESRRAAAGAGEGAIVTGFVAALGAPEVGRAGHVVPAAGAAATAVGAITDEGVDEEGESDKENEAA